MDNKNILFINLTSGLCNQLNTIAKSIILAEIFKRDIYFQSFQIHYLSSLDNSCPNHL